MAGAAGGLARGSERRPFTITDLFEVVCRSSGRRNFELNGFASKIKLFDGNALEVIDRLPRDQMFDLVFIDGNKERYQDYVIKTEPLLAKNGIMIVDDASITATCSTRSRPTPRGLAPKPAWIISRAATIGCGSRCRRPTASS